MRWRIRGTIRADEKARESVTDAKARADAAACKATTKTALAKVEVRVDPEKKDGEYVEVDQIFADEKEFRAAWEEFAKQKGCDLAAHRCQHYDDDGVYTPKSVGDCVVEERIET